MGDEDGRCYIKQNTTSGSGNLGNDIFSGNIIISLSLTWTYGVGGNDDMTSWRFLPEDYTEIYRDYDPDRHWPGGSRPGSYLWRFVMQTNIDNIPGKTFTFDLDRLNLNTRPKMFTAFVFRAKV